MEPFTKGLGLLKQELSKDYQETYLELFEFGTKNQRVEIISDKILFYSTHKRVFAMKSLDNKVRAFTRMVDVLLIDEFKESLWRRLESKYGFQILTILQDYDPKVELSATLVFLSQDITRYLSK